MTYEEVEAYLQRGPGIAILASGATEQHGVHGAIGTDTFAAMVVAERTAERIAEDKRRFLELFAVPAPY